MIMDVRAKSDQAINTASERADYHLVYYRVRRKYLRVYIIRPAQIRLMLKGSQGGGMSHR